MLGILDITVHLWFAFDIGYEVQLDRARPLLSAAEGVLQRRRRTPDSIRYRPAPLRLEIDHQPMRLPLPTSMGAPEAPSAELSVFDFGAVSLHYQLRIKVSAEGLSALSVALADPSPWVDQARAMIMPWVERITPAVTDYEFSQLYEEYIVFQAHGARTDWFAASTPWIAGLVRCEGGPLSASEIQEATRLHMSYTPSDLLVLDWPAGFLADDDCADTLQVLEFVNVQLLEFRLIDDNLDDRLEAAYRLIHPEVRSSPQRNRLIRALTAWPRGLRQQPWKTHSQAVRQVRELEIEATSLFERADNALKLIGDQYLARVYKLASARFHLDEWQQSIQRKLEAVGNVYDLLVQQAGEVRSEFLELVIILLIMGEILLSLLRNH